jgi:putative lipoprotein
VFRLRRGEGNLTPEGMSYMVSKMLFIGLTLVVMAGPVVSQEPAAPAPSSKQAPEYQTAIKWKRFDYSCEGEQKLTVYLHDQTVKVRFKDSNYLMRQVPSADGGRYSDGKVVWWGVGNGGFLQEDSPDGDGKMIVKDCKLDNGVTTASNVRGNIAGSVVRSVTGAVTYLQRMGLPPTAVIQVQLLDVSLADAPSKAIAEDKITLGDRQVPVPFELKFDPSSIDPQHSYSVSAKIMVDGELRFISNQSHPVLTHGNPSKVEIVVKPTAPQSSNRP